MAVADITRFQEVLTGAKGALIVIPQDPSLDRVAAGLALGLALEKGGISTVFSSPQPMTVEFNRLVGVNKVRQELGEKNLVISFANYPPEGIERVSYDIDNGQFTLTVIPKSGNNTPMQDQINFSYSSGNCDLVIVVGANYPEGLGSFAQNEELLAKENIVLLGNTPLAGWQKAIELIDPSQASISEVVYDIIETLKLPMDEDVATNLLAGIEAGTHNFTSKNVTVGTFTKAAQLLQNGARRGMPVTIAGQQVSTAPGTHMPGFTSEKLDKAGGFMQHKQDRGPMLP